MHGRRRPGALGCFELCAWGWALPMAVWAACGGPMVAGGVVTNCTEAALRAALAGGGVVTLECSGTITVTSTLIITQDTTVSATGWDLTLSGGGGLRLFEVGTNVSVTLVDLRLANGRHEGAEGQAGAGGAVFNAGGRVQLTRCELTNNFAVGGTAFSFVTNCGTILCTVTDPGKAGAGGAIFNAGGRVRLVDCVLVGNSATGGGGGAVVGPSGPGTGGGIASMGGTLTLVRARFQLNAAAAGVSGVGGAGAHGAAEGGAVWASDTVLTAIACQFVENRAEVPTMVEGTTSPGRGGAVHVVGGTSVFQRTQFLTNRVHGGTVLRGAGAAGEGGAVFSSANLTLVECALEGNQSVGGGGRSAYVEVPGGGVGRAGAVANRGAMVVERCTFNGNQTVGGEGYYYLTFPRTGAPAFGGAISSHGPMAVTNSTFHANAAVGGDGSGAGGGEARGGGVYHDGGDFWNPAVAVVASTTLAANSAMGGRTDSVTPGSPRAASFGGALFVLNKSIWLGNSIVSASPSGGNVGGTVDDRGNNLSSDATPLFTTASSRNDLDPKLGGLSDNGGSTWTMPLLAGSPAIDAGESLHCSPTDQRGYPRPADGGCDIGAYEAGAAPSSLRLTILLPDSETALIHVDGPPGSRHVLERSSGLPQWMPVWTNATLPFDFIEAVNGSYGTRLNRARTDP